MKQFVAFDSLTVIPMATIEINSDFRVKIEPSKENNLGKTGFVMIDKLTTIKKSGLGEYIGHIEDKYIDQIENALLKFIVYYNGAGVDRLGYGKAGLYSVRCVQD